MGPFYPPEVHQSELLTVYARGFDTVEVDSTFYGTPPASTVQSWGSRVPPKFVFALKAPQEITHHRRLRDAEDVTAEFFERVRGLGKRLGPVLLQFPPDFGPAELPALAGFLPILPRDCRVAVEFRHRGWVHDGVLALLSEHNVALAITDARFIPRKTALALAVRPTADFAYLRWLGPNRDLVDHSRIQVDRSRETETWAAAIRELATKVKSVYGYMGNHFAGHAPASARALQEMLGQVPVPPENLGDQLILL